MIYKRFGSGYFGQTMVCIARRESGLNPRAANWHDSHGGSFGLFQINGIHKPGYESLSHFYQRMSDPRTNIESAWALSGHGHTLSPWGNGC